MLSGLFRRNLYWETYNHVECKGVRSQMARFLPTQMHVRPTFFHDSQLTRMNGCLGQLVPNEYPNRYTTKTQLNTYSLQCKSKVKSPT